MNETVNTTWLGDMAFEAVIDGFTVKMDADPKAGGAGKAPRPKPFVLSALAGCTGMDVISILRKKKINPAGFRILVEGRLTDDHPKFYRDITVVYEVSGPGFEQDPEILAAAHRAVELSSEKYCGVSAMLKGSCNIIHEVRILNS